MTAFEKCLREFDEEALRAGAEELLVLLAGADGVQRRRGAAEARVPALVAADISPEKGGERSTASAADAPAQNGVVPETARGRRAYPKTDGGGPTAEKDGRKDEVLPEPAFPGETAVEERNGRKSCEDREAQEDHGNREAPEDRTEREDREMQTQTLRAEDGETVDRAETQALEKRLQSLSEQRRGKARQSGEDGESGAHTAAFRGPEWQFEGAVGARSMEMRRISDYFRRDSRRYDTGFTTY